MRTPAKREVVLLALVLMTGVALTSGCRDEPDLMVPPPIELSRSSLAKALEAWKAGSPAGGKLLGSSPGIGVVDTLQAERRLIDFEIVGPLFALPEARPFAVRLTVDSPREVLPVRYVVLGRDPIWVFRQEDYELILHWEHKMPKDDSKDALSPTQGPVPGTP